MYKLKNSYIDNMISAKLSSREIDFILYIARFQDDSGTVWSVYYKEICEAIHISIQKFYDIIDSLTDKGLITWKKENPADIVVSLIGNDFSSKDFSSGYLNVAKKDFQSEKFLKMKAGSKLLFLYLQRFINGKHMLVQNFYDEFCRIFKVTAKSLQQYLHQLKKNFFLFISKKRNRAYRYEMTMKNSTVLDHKSHFDIGREKEGYFANLGDMIKRKYKRFLPDKDPDRVINDVIRLMDSERIRGLGDFMSYILRAIESSINQQRSEGKKHPWLNAALINKKLTKIIEMA